MCATGALNGSTQRLWLIPLTWSVSMLILPAACLSFEYVFAHPCWPNSIAACGTAIFSIEHGLYVLPMFLVYLKMAHGRLHGPTWPMVGHCPSGAYPRSTLYQVASLDAVLPCGCYCWCTAAPDRERGRFQRVSQQHCSRRFSMLLQQVQQWPALPHSATASKRAVFVPM
jgi:hypothetical protein